MSKPNTALELHALRHELNWRSETVQAAGIGLCAIAKLLGADGEDRELGEELTSGLAHAVLAVGELLNTTGGRLWEISATAAPAVLRKQDGEAAVGGAV